MLTEGFLRIILMVIVLTAIIVILVRFRATKSDEESRDSLNVLKEKLDKGEISREEYEDAKRRRGK
ncbi:SHOCT domain-containing protein [Virgibacillus sediminis]|uniref:SHOCT domain-containing protein n=1 Tax=Virgibacillus sediminis TaxID=202260 RepID=A0ABV7A3N3_9BACI